jgi:hypothetical protein
VFRRRYGALVWMPSLNTENPVYGVELLGSTRTDAGFPRDTHPAGALERVQVRGLRGIFVSDRDGVPILGHSTLQPSPSLGNKTSERTAPLDGAFALSADQVQN